MRVYREENVIEHFHRWGQVLRDELNGVAARLGIASQFEVLGQPSNLVFATRDNGGQPSQAFRTLFMQECIRRGLLAPSLVLSLAHGEREVYRTVQIVADVLEIYRRALAEGVGQFVEGRFIKPVFREFN